MLSNLLRFGLLLTLVYPGSTLLAADNACKYDADQPTTYDIGVFARHKVSPYRDWDGDESIIIPSVTVEAGRFYIKGAGAGYVLSDCQTINNGFQLDLTGKLGFFGYDDSDSDFLEGMDDRSDISLSIGLEGTWDTDKGDLSLEVGHDATNTYDGLTAQFRYQLGWQSQNKRLLVLPSIGLNYYDENFNNYYYGIEADEARSFRSAYEADSSFNPVIEITTIYVFSAKSNGYLNLSHESLDDEITDSPLISEKEIVTLSLGYNYKLR